MKPEIEISINGKRSTMFTVRGIAIVDGISIPFTAYRTVWALCDTILTESDNRIAVRTKHGIINTYSEVDYIKGKLRDAAKGWWIDKDLWRL